MVTVKSAVPLGNVFTRGSPSERHTRCSRSDIRRIAQEAIEQVLPVLEGRRHQFLLKPTPYASMVSDDAKRLTQVVTNLRINSAKYTAEQRQIL